ncbi:GlxA family transcriptional regulator [Thalassococcus sp. S3]|uniref:GlxA family transcriptional regulator n=1 Tax=Thalassococcus sp. S3 TaxID=2017482 RepID=UPI0010241029|nr:GlxA family transcriptional regulator [Thalassococcus sp. S3]QBF29770.1 AraC family transcriptional regulator [Thalassococcus sp. S3]
MTQTPKRYAFLLLPGYSQLGFACAVEALSLANRHPSGQAYYQWRLIGETGMPVPAYNGVTAAVEAALPSLERDEVIVVCAGEDAGNVSSPNVLNWLRKETRKGMDFGALSRGSYTLALAGLIDGKRVTTHWEYHNALSELLPDVIVESGIFAVDGRVFTCAGGAASMDLMLHRVHAEYGIELATWVADQMVYTAPRAEHHGQRLSLRVSGEPRHAKLSLALQVMQNNIEDPLSPDEIAAVVSLSTRQLERLFARYMATSPKRHYLRMRLEKARHLLRQTDMSVTEICLSCGFNSASHFSKSYPKAFGVSPSLDAAGQEFVWAGG